MNGVACSIQCQPATLQIINMEIHAVRLRNLEEKIREFSSLADFADCYDLDADHISAFIHEQLHIGAKAARNIEALIGWPSMYMDSLHTLNEEECFEASLGASGYGSSSRAYAQIPLISHVQAGLWTESVNAYEHGSGQEYIPTQIATGPHAFAVSIRGDSMLPEFRDGDIVIIDPSVPPAPGDLVVASNEQHEATFKKYRPRGMNEYGEPIVELVPLNEDFPTLRSDSTAFSIVGTMLEHRRYRKRV